MLPTEHFLLFSLFRLCVKMYRGLLLVFLILLVETRLSESSCAEQETQRSASDESSSFRLATRNLLKRYHDIDYDSFVGLMGRRSADAAAAAEDQSQRKREMHDIFVGLMGRRNSEDDTERPWRKDYPETRGLFFNKCRLRFRRGL
ncbi:tachykinin-3a isoform X1 [Ictalurus punctatus]|uniref:Tachykinin-3a isoform X1 n=2 Tax=Ictalurus punctatus TaxID=7998 RepID=A0A9F7RGC7_ICTPU|nr:tachykinin-3a isoform X1 [Ictalurus punctatus]